MRRPLGCVGIWDSGDDSTAHLRSRHAPRDGNVAITLRVMQPFAPLDLRLVAEWSDQLHHAERDGYYRSLFLLERMHGPFEN